METSISETAGNNEELRLDINVLNDRGETYTSLMDLYSIAVFTDEMDQRSTHIKEEKEGEVKQLQKKVFGETKTSQSEEKELQDQLFTASYLSNKKIRYEQEPASGYLSYMGGIVLGLLVLGLMIGYINTRKKRRETDEGERIYE